MLFLPFTPMTYRVYPPLTYQSLTKRCEYESSVINILSCPTYCWIDNRATFLLLRAQRPQ